MPFLRFQNFGKGIFRTNYIRVELRISLMDRGLCSKRSMNFSFTVATSRSTIIIETIVTFILNISIDSASTFKSFCWNFNCLTAQLNLLFTSTFSAIIILNLLFYNKCVRIMIGDERHNHK